MCIKGVVNKTHLEDKIGFKGLQWVLSGATFVSEHAPPLIVAMGRSRGESTRLETAHHARSVESTVAL